MPVCSSSLVLTVMIYACLATAINLCLSQTFMRIAGIGAILSLLSPVVSNVVAAVQFEVGNGFTAPYTKRDIFSLKVADSQSPAPLPRHISLWQGLKFRLYKISRPSDTTPTTGS
ncbi:hypothetical protein BD779DRAFT_1488706 [Infundibulicybe gibba]|nr:hypothetical protein BD779DRAFT_1488706 [Infundibulicybe gibba]